MLFVISDSQHLTTNIWFLSAKLNAKNLIPTFCHVFCFFLNNNPHVLTAIYDLALRIKDILRPEYRFYECHFFTLNSSLSLFEPNLYNLTVDYKNIQNRPEISTNFAMLRNSVPNVIFLSVSSPTKLFYLSL